MTQRDQRTSNFRFAHLQESLVDSNETVFPFSLPRHHLTDFDFLLGIRERSNSVATAKKIQSVRASTTEQKERSTDGTMSTKTASKLTIAMTRISRSTMMGRSPALRAEEEDENLGPVSERRRLRRLSCSKIRGLTFDQRPKKREN